MHPAKLAGVGYMSYILVGWGLLCIPLVQRERVGALDNLFTATSAVSTTGLVTVSISDNYNIIGQVIVLALIQFGGIGYMTFGSFVILSTRGELPQQRSGIGKTVFSLPDSFRIDKFIRSVMVFTVAIELAGVLALWPALARAGAPMPLWSAVFHSVSAFCTAGFSLYNSSFEAFRGDFWLNAIIAVLSYCGAIGFIVWVDCWRMITGKVSRVTLTTKIILWSTVWISVAGALLIFLAEPALKPSSTEESVLAAAFQSMTAMTTVGFNTLPIGELSKATLLVLILLMIVGASPSGTGGGLKCTTVTAVAGVIRSVLRGDEQVRFWGRPIPGPRVRIATASLGFYLAMLFIGTYLLELLEKSPFEQNLFEAASALGTVGLSTGITGSLTNLGKLVIIALMFCGRLGPLTFGMALFFRSPGDSSTSDSDLAV